MKNHSSLELNDTKIQNIESVLKYVRLTRTVKSLDLSYTNLSPRAIQKIVIDLNDREYPLYLSTLNLSRNLGISDEVCKVLALLFSNKSPVKHLYLDDTSIT